MSANISQQGSLILRLMTQFARDFVSSVEGTKFDISTKELSGGARIYYIFNDVFGQALTSIDATHNLDNQDIRTAIRNSTGPRPSLFVPEVAFDLLVKPQIKLLEAPGLRCVELVYEELVKICHNCTSAVSTPVLLRNFFFNFSQELQRFPRLHAQLIEVVSELLRERLGPTSEYAQSLIEIQAAYINTNHPAFISGSTAASQQTPTPAKPLISSRVRHSYQEFSPSLLITVFIISQLQQNILMVVQHLVRILTRSSRMISMLQRASFRPVKIVLRLDRMIVHVRRVQYPPSSTPPIRTMLLASVLHPKHAPVALLKHISVRPHSLAALAIRLLVRVRRS